MPISTLAHALVWHVGDCDARRDFDSTRRQTSRKWSEDGPERLAILPEWETGRERDGGAELPMPSMAGRRAVARNASGQSQWASAASAFNECQRPPVGPAGGRARAG